MLEIFFSREKTIEIDGIELNIVDNGDYRGILTMLVSLYQYPKRQQTLIAVSKFYEIPIKQLVSEHKNRLNELINSMEFFLSYTQSHAPKGNTTKTVETNWETDMPYIISAILKTHKIDIVQMEYLHWWKFLSYLNEIDGDTTLAYINNIRNKRVRGGKENELSKSEKDFIKSKPNLFKPRKNII